MRPSNSFWQIAITSRCPVRHAATESSPERHAAGLDQAGATRTGTSRSSAASAGARPSTCPVTLRNRQTPSSWHSSRRDRGGRRHPDDGHHQGGAPEHNVPRDTGKRARSAGLRLRQDAEALHPNPAGRPRGRGVVALRFDARTDHVPLQVAVSSLQPGRLRQVAVRVLTAEWSAQIAPFSNGVSSTNSDSAVQPAFLVASRNVLSVATPSRRSFTTY